MYISINNSYLKIRHSLKDLKNQSFESSERLDSMIETYLQLQKSLDEKDLEIKRLKKGYDKELYRKFLYRFIRVDETLFEILEDENTENSDLKMVKRLMEDAFFECGVERYSPEIGADYTKIDGVEDNPQKIFTDNSDNEFTIAEIIQEGYILKNDESFETLVPAKVRIFVTQKEE